MAQLRSVIVPDVLGLPYQAARDTLASRGLRGFGFPPGPREPLGVVIAQQPKAGTRVAQGSTDTLMFGPPASAPPPPQLPDLAIADLASSSASGRVSIVVTNVGAAQSSSWSIRAWLSDSLFLAAAYPGLAGGESRSIQGPLPPHLGAGTYLIVARVLPDPASRDARDDNDVRQAILRIPQTPPPTPTVTAPAKAVRESTVVPALAGMTRDEAEQALGGARLALGRVSRTRAFEPLGTAVVTQTPQAGSRVPVRSRVSIVLATSWQRVIPWAAGLAVVGAAIGYLIARATGGSSHAGAGSVEVAIVPGASTSAVASIEGRGVSFGYRAIDAELSLRLDIADTQRLHEGGSP